MLRKIFFAISIFLLIPLLISLLTLLAQFGYFMANQKINYTDSLSFSMLLEEHPENVFLNFNTDELLVGDKAEGKFLATENNLGIVLVRFTYNFSKSKDYVVFRIKEQGQRAWYYEKKYQAYYFPPDHYFTFGFPVISNSRGKQYTFEIESLDGKHPLTVSLSPKKPHTAVAYKFSKKELLKDKNLFINFLSKKIKNAEGFIDHSIPIKVFIFSFSIIALLSIRKRLANILGFLWKERSNPKKIQNKIQKILIKYEYNIENSRTYKKISKFPHKRMVLIWILFLVALTVRISFYFSNLTDAFYAGLGGGGDYDQYIRFSTCALTKFDDCYGSIIYNFIFITRILAFFYLIFGFIGGIKTALIFFILINCITVVLPYIILSRKNYLTLGGIFASLILATNEAFIRISIGFPVDNSSALVFTVLFFIYLLVLEKKTIKYFVLLGAAGTVDGLNKVLFLINNLVVFTGIIPVLAIDEFKKNRRKLIILVIPLLVFSLTYIGWEIFVDQKFSQYYFLRQLFEYQGGQYNYYIEGKGSLSQSVFSATSALFNFLDLPSFLYLGLVLGIIFYTYKYREMFRIKNLLNLVHAGIKLSLPIAPYFVMLVLMVQRAPYERLYVQPAIWVIIFIGFILDLIILKIISQKYVKNIKLILILFFVVFYLLPRTVNYATNFPGSLNGYYKKVEYFKWVNKNLPDNAVVLGGGGDDLIVLADNIKNPLVYNSLYGGAVLIESNEMPDILNGFSIKENYRYFILDKKIYHEGLNGNYMKRFELKLYKFNDPGHLIYELIPKS